MQYWVGRKSLCTCTLLEVRKSHVLHILRCTRDMSHACGVTSNSSCIGKYRTFTVTLTLPNIRQVHMEFFDHSVEIIAICRQSTTYIICNEKRERYDIYA